jgi:hypothetical protein
MLNWLLFEKLKKNFFKRYSLSVTIPDMKDEPFEKDLFAVIFFGKCKLCRTNNREDTISVYANIGTGAKAIHS